MQEKDLLQKAMQQKNMMVLYRDELVAPEYAGVPVAVENELVVLQRQTNFVLDGYCALRTGDITEVEQMDDVPFLKKVMAGEKLYDAVKVPGFACRGWQELLEGTGAIRVHGGGFAGTIQAFVPNDRLEAFRSGMEALLGRGKCYILHIRPQGGTVVIGQI